MKITVYGVIHYVAQCANCDWCKGFNTEETFTRQAVRNKVKRHVRETGHTVNVESGTSTEYKP